MKAVTLQQWGIGRHGMARDIKPQQFLLISEQLMLRPLRQLSTGIGSRRRVVFQQVEQRTLAALPVISEFCRPIEGAVKISKHGSARFSEAVAGSAFDECFQGLAVGGPVIHSFAKVGETLQTAPLLAGLDDPFDRDLPDALNGGEPKADGSRWRRSQGV